MKKKALVQNPLQICQKSQCKELGLIVFGFMLHDAQAEAIHTLFFEQRDLLLLTMKSFRKSFIFQLLLFFTTTSRIVLTLILLKLS